MARVTTKRRLGPDAQVDDKALVIDPTEPSLCDPFLVLSEDWFSTPGFEWHPHRGLETVTTVLDGVLEHGDNLGNTGALHSGDVQWMTAGRGIVHSEMPSQTMRQRGGRMHGFQIWVNLPARAKMTVPHYQEIPRAGIPEAATPDGLASVHVIAGEALGAKAVIETKTPIGFLHWIFAPGASVDVPVLPEQAAYLYVFEGTVRVAGREVKDGELAILGDGNAIHLEAVERAQALLLSGVPLREPVVQYGPFVMNTEREIMEAVEDYQAGRLGEIAR